ncbi:MAG: 23S rRNA (adenine(2503)-C(2))-methyltransferase RlmN, partial [Atribacterota bacterium]
EKQGINIGARKITISTCGIIPGIKKFAQNPLQAELSVSLHAAEDNIRNFLMPVNKKYPLIKLIPACKDYVKKKKRQITFEYMMLKGVNDSQEQVKKLCHLISDFQPKAKVNLIIYNPVFKQTRLSPSEDNVVLYFQRTLKKCHIPVTIRYSKGQDIEAACGQLRGTFLNL